MRRFGELPAMLALREALPWSLAGLAAGIIIFFGASFSQGSEPFSKRYAAALLPGFGLMSVTLCAILPVYLARRMRLYAPALIAVCLAAFFLARPSGAIHDLQSYLRAIGASGLFLAIVIALLCAGVFRLCLRTMYSPPRITQIIAGLIVVSVAATLYAAHISLLDGVIAVLQPLGFLGDTYLALLVITCVEMLLWTAGVHGPALLGGIVTPVYLLLQQQNTAAYDAHLPLPHIVVVSLFLFVFPGGAGATLPLVFMLMTSRVKRLRKVGRLTVLPSLFNVNEPLIFGLPLVLNPFFAIPFVVAPAILATVTYAAVRWGLVMRPAFYYPSSIPSVLSTYMATLDWRAAVLVVVNAAIAAAVYWPFFRAYERHEAPRA